MLGLLFPHLLYPNLWAYVVWDSSLLPRGLEGSQVRLSSLGLISTLSSLSQEDENIAGTF